MADALKLANAHWPQLVLAAGQDPAAYRIVARWSRDEPERHRLILGLGDATGMHLVYKRVFRPMTPATFALAVDAQAQVSRALASHPVARMPDVLARDDEVQAVLMQAAQGPTMFELCDSSPDHGEMLQKAGIWLAAFHRAGPTEPRRFQPRHMAEHMAKLAAQVREGTKRVAAPEQFIAHVARLQSLAGAAQGAPTVSAQKHGDIHARNLIFDDGLIWGIDPSPTTAAPVGYDIARLLCRYAQDYVDPATIATGEVLPPALTDAFFRGYDLTDAADKAVQFLMQVRLLTDWTSLPSRVADMSMAKLLRLRRLQKLAARTFA